MKDKQKKVPFLANAEKEPKKSEDSRLKRELSDQDLAAISGGTNRRGGFAVGGYNSS